MEQAPRYIDADYEVVRPERRGVSGFSLLWGAVQLVAGALGLVLLTWIVIWGFWLAYLIKSMVELLLHH